MGPRRGSVEAGREEGLSPAGEEGLGGGNFGGSGVRGGSEKAHCLLGERC